MAASLRTAIDEARAIRRASAGNRCPRLGVVLALGRIEAKQMLRHPAFWLSVAFALLLLRGAVGVCSETAASSSTSRGSSAASRVGALIGGVLTANVAALRARRDHLRELSGRCRRPRKRARLGCSPAS